MILWLNQNAGAITALLTVVYVLATIAIMIMNYKTVKEMKLSREQISAPHIVVSFETRRKGLLCLVLRNLGGSVATELNILLDNDFINCLPRDNEKFKKLGEISLTIVPNQEIIYVLGGPNDFSNLSRVKMVGLLVYYDLFNKYHEEVFDIDLESFGGTLLYGPDELTAVIEKGFSDIKNAILTKS